MELTSVTRQLLKTCIFENFIQRSDEIIIGAITLSAIRHNVPFDLWIEIVIIVTQPIERVGVFVVTDRA